MCRIGSPVQNEHRQEKEVIARSTRQVMDGSSARWGRLEVHPQGSISKNGWKIGRGVRQSWVLGNDLRSSAGAARGIKRQSLMWATSLPFCNVFLLPYGAETHTCQDLTRSSKKNQAYLKTVSLTIPVLTTICRASSSWKCWTTTTETSLRCQVLSTPTPVLSWTNCTSLGVAGTRSLAVPDHSCAARSVLRQLEMEKVGRRRLVVVSRKTAGSEGVASTRGMTLQSGLRLLTFPSAPATNCLCDHVQAIPLFALTFLILKSVGQ